jgi:hypothetical protein
VSTPDVATIATALGSALSTISGLRVLDYLSDTFTPPAALVGIDTVDFHGAFSDTGDVVHDFTVFVIIARSSERAGIVTLEGFMSQSGTPSIRAALEADRTLGGVVSSLKVTKAGPPASVSINGAEYVSVPFAVEVHA